MNVPWTGFPLKSLLLAVEPKSSATHVRFVSALNKEVMPGAAEAHWYPWPYHEGLRLEEAMNELAFVVTGAYGKPLLRQHGAPARRHHAHFQRPAADSRAADQNAQRPRSG